VSELLLPDHEPLWVYRIDLDGETALVAFNFDDSETTVAIDELARAEALLLSNYSDAMPAEKTVTLRPYEARVYALA